MSILVSMGRFIHTVRYPNPRKITYSHKQMVAQVRSIVLFVTLLQNWILRPVRLCYGRCVSVVLEDMWYLRMIYRNDSICSNLELLDRVGLGESYSLMKVSSFSHPWIYVSMPYTDQNMYFLLQNTWAHHTSLINLVEDNMVYLVLLLSESWAIYPRKPIFKASLQW